MKFTLIFLIIFSSINFSMSQSTNQQLIESFFNAVQKNAKEEAELLNKEIAVIDQEKLLKELDTDEKRKAFWLNTYNAYIQYLLKKDPSLYDDRSSFFSEKRLLIAGEKLSFDIIEHGIIRRSVHKYSLGYLNKWNVSKFEKKFRVQKIDPRIHFALNCGAKSCPMLRLYHSETINEELDTNTKDYLELNVKVTEDKINVPSLFSWFRADFGGKNGIRNFLEKYQLTKKEDRKKTLVFSEYDWTLDVE